MNVYVETNFVLELAFQQEQHNSCESILLLCESGKTNLFIPAYSLVEPHEKLKRQYNRRRELQSLLDAEIRQLARTSSYTSRINSIRDLSSLLVQSNEEEKERFDSYRQRILKIARVIPLTVKIIKAAANYENAYDLTPQDAHVYASVIFHLRKKLSADNCFLNRNTRDFDNPDIVDELEKNNCKMIPRFDDGYKFIHKQSTP